MFPLYLLVVDIESNDAHLPENTFRECISASLSHLEALQEAFGRYPFDISFHQPGEIEGCAGWSVRAIVSIAVGRKREKGLAGLCTALMKLIQFELPGLKVSGGFERYEFEN